ncbi:hypothetical protein [Solitalea koreensis]|uniref:Lipoprotein n=1 Tax=Solitalea koreensis TaxID=543615 RepID=A0A521EE30_9SPHI|nr:hypothetical protein [Solitalea koreensis]SMO82179.1 hypothetical protein SAMN06265350_1142 [Solitalea koreensis]
MKTLSLLKTSAVALLLVSACTKSEKVSVNTEDAILQKAIEKCGCPCNNGCESGKVTAGSCTVNNGSDVNITFSFHGDGIKKTGDIGEFEFVDHNNKEENRHGDVICLKIQHVGDNEIAWFVGVESKNSVSPGSLAIWRADDNGEPAHKDDPKDQVSLPRFGVDPKDARAVCACDFTVGVNPFIDLTSGNIQFHKDLTE